MLSPSDVPHRIHDKLGNMASQMLTRVLSQFVELCYALDQRYLILKDAA